MDNSSNTNRAADYIIRLLDNRAGGVSEAELEVYAINCGRVAGEGLTTDDVSAALDMLEAGAYVAIDGAATVTVKAGQAARWAMKALWR